MFHEPPFTSNRQHRAQARESERERESESGFLQKFILLVCEMRRVRMFSNLHFNPDDPTTPEYVGAC